MKFCKKMCSVLLALLLTVGAFGMGNVFAAELPDYVQTQEEWNSYWETVKGDNTMIALTPGSDATKMGFSWHSNTMEWSPVVTVSKNADMSQSESFCGYTIIDAETKQPVHRVTVSGLSEDTVYYYSYGSKDKQSEPSFFRTAATAHFKALFVSDVQCGSEDDSGTKVRDEAYLWQKMLGNAISRNPDSAMVLSLGDQTENGSIADEWVGTLAPQALRNFPMATVIGNHDNKGLSYRFYSNNPNEYWGTTPSLPGQNYWFRYGDVLFLVFNSSNPNAIDHFNFAKQAILKNEDATWRVAMIHHDIYGPGRLANDNDSKLLRAMFSSIFDKFEVDFCLDGHDHYYGRSHYMYNNVVVTDNDIQNNVATDPKGTIYFTANSASGKQGVREIVYDYEWLDFELNTANILYSTLEFDRDSFALKTFDADTGEQVDSYTIQKTENRYAKVDENAKLDGGNLVDRYTGDFSEPLKAAKNLITGILGGETGFVSILKQVFALFSALIQEIQRMF